MTAKELLQNVLAHGFEVELEESPEGFSAKAKGPAQPAHLEPPGTTTLRTGPWPTRLEAAREIHRLVRAEFIRPHLLPGEAVVSQREARALWDACQHDDQARNAVEELLFPRVS